MKTSRAALVALACVFLSLTAVSQSPEGPWVGAINVAGTELNIMVTFTSKGDSVGASIDIPQQMALGLRLKNVTWKPPKTHFELPAGPGLAVFDGVVAEDSIHGRFTQAGFAGTFRLGRGKDTRKEEVKRPAEPPPPYREEEIVFKSDSLTIAGTLTVPPGNGRHPAVVMITGSGANNRDEELLGFKPFRLIADHFTRHGFAVLRCDDRGVGESTGRKTNATTADHALDVLAEVKFLQARADINPLQIGLCGHSEGGIVAPIAAGKSGDVAFVVLIAGPSIPGAKLVLFQIESIMRSGGAGEAEIRRVLDQQERAFECVRTGKGWDALGEELKSEAASGLASMPPGKRKEVFDSAAFVNGNIDMQLASARSPWFKYFIDFDPAQTLPLVRCPVLALFGELDMQVPVSLNKQGMESALRKGLTKDWRVEVLPKANHLFITAVTGSTTEYAALEKKFVPGFLEVMTKWITQRVSVLSGGSAEQEH